MRNYFVFLGKEIMELLRTKKLLGIGCIFLFFAFTSPLLARYMAEFLALLVPADEMLGFLIPDPNWMDSYAQFYSNLVQIGSLTILLLFMGTITSEKSRGTKELVLTKGFSHTGFVLSKFTVIAGTVLITSLVSTGIVFIYTNVLFDTAGNFADVFLGALVYALFAITVVALTILASALAKTSVVAAMIGMLGFFGIFILSSIHRLGDYLPGNLSGRAVEITSGYYHAHLVGNIIVALVFITACLALSILTLKKQEGA